MFYFMTEKLHFEPELFGRFAAVQAIANIVGIYCYSKFCKQLNVRKLYVTTTYLVTLFCLMSVVLVKRWNVNMGIPDVAFILTDDSILEFFNEIHALPILVLSVRLCPQGIESSMYSLLWTVQLMGINVSTYISAICTYLLGVNNKNFDGLVPLIVICSLLHLAPVFFVWMIPEELPEENVQEKNPEMELYIP
ncbi:conserved hypothetical protein [Theileria equi strain WA]|uniref:Uncharacterized protein n=1 Tax=Theileria equi strain WA TaxID=1537102 RepID=L1LEI4_THEEQ|nr:conserved hypothetical protein [Theileria equi strain WA]EKX73832.1 conserved hypothetical protein [Theileria equi strain WA]|eukprot:XP_004833284.1 conserved hypothetical protein [Theileria equi strain WA]